MVYSGMAKTFSHQSISLDGFTAAPNQSADNPFGEGGMRLPAWMFSGSDGQAGPDQAIEDEIIGGAGAFIMGRNMFGPGRGPWDMTWEGWWGEDPPYHAPVFVLTHHARDPLTMQGGTTFTFVTDGPESAYELAKAAAGDKDIAVAGGAATIRQYLRLGLIDELNLHIVPITLGAGERLFDDVGDLTFEPIEVKASPAVTHVKYRTIRGSA
jgi:dihydrofolate reductase